MIKITKPGQKEFHGFCKWCGCEFTYEISDLKLSATSDKVSCPTCGKDYHHPSMVQDPTIPGGIGYRGLQDITWPPNPIPCTPDMTKTDPCAGCTWRENLLREEGIYIGDTPCTWCNKNEFNSITTSTSPLTGTIQGISQPETYLTPCVEHLDAKVTCKTTEGKVQATGVSGYGYSCSTTSKKVPGTYTTAHNSCCDDTEGRNSCSGEHKCDGKKNCKDKH
jgi:hypothetical protein